MDTETKIFVGLGCNLGSRRKNLKTARNRLGEEFQIARESTILKTSPVGFNSSTLFLNQVLQLSVKSTSEPKIVLKTLLRVERDLGRNRTASRDRVIDLDLLYWGNRIRKTDPILPHPRVHQRAFVLKSMVELDPGFQHPLLKQTQRQLLEQQYVDRNSV